MIATRHPKMGQDGPRWSRDSPKMVQDGLQDDHQMVPTYCKDGQHAKLTPKRPQNGPRCLQNGQTWPQAGLLGSMLHVQIDAHVHHRSKYSTVRRCNLKPDWSSTSSKEMHDATPALGAFPGHVGSFPSKPLLRAFQDLF